jgi:hypothetical protein
MAWLRGPKLIERILQDYEGCGFVGESTNKLVCYLACVSRLLSQPLAVMVQSGSAAGKTTLMDNTLAFMPDEQRHRYSSITSKSLYYMSSIDLRHKILAICEEDGASQASYALKLLQSDGRLTIATTGKQQGTGRQQTETYEVEGPVMLFLTTTAEEPDPELLNRCLVLRVNESSEQTIAIQSRQRAAFLGATSVDVVDCQTMRRIHQNAQRLLERIPVVIPWADQLRFRSDQTRMRRDHAKYLSLISAITLLHQYQRPRKVRLVEQLGAEPKEVPYVESTRDDIALANQIMHELYGQSLDDLLPQTRQLLVLIDNFVNQRSAAEKKPRVMIRFTQRNLRETIGWSGYQIQHHLSRLVDLEYVLAFRTGHGNQREYQLLYDGEGRTGDKVSLGLVDPASLTDPPTE